MNVVYSYDAPDVPSALNKIAGLLQSKAQFAVLYDRGEYHISYIQPKEQPDEHKIA